MCDVVVGDANSTFLLPFVQIGMVPDLGLHATLSYRVGLARARRMLLMADRSDGKQAFTIGLVDVLAAPGEVQDRALEVARKLANGPASAIASMKRGICVAAAQLDAVLEYEAAAMTVAMTGVEVREGAQAFREHRPPQFR
jgi:enoyl-CoA hydratase/carnithine racemase